MVYIIKEEYSSYKKEYKPIAYAVTYLMYSGMSHPGFNFFICFNFLIKKIKN